MQQTYARDLAETINWAQRTISDPKAVYLDTETTGLGRDAEIVDVAVISAAGRILFQTLVKPLQSIPVDATNIHGIDDTMVETARRWTEVASQLGDVLAGATSVIIYNADFDTRIMDQCNLRHGLPPFRSNWQCAMHRYASFAGQRHPRYGGYRWHKLTDAAAAFGYHEATQHRALGDSRLCRAVVHGIANTCSHEMCSD